MNGLSPECGKGPVSDAAFETTMPPETKEDRAINSYGTEHDNTDTTVPQGNEPTTRLEWLDGLTACRDLLELGIRLAWGWKAGLLFSGADRAKPTRTATPRRGGLFPLPVKLPVELAWSVAGFNPCKLRSLAIDCWVALGCVAINRLYGVTCAETHRAGKIHVAVLAELRNKIDRFLRGNCSQTVVFSETVSELKSKKLSYTGEEIPQPHALTPEQILKGLPRPKGLMSTDKRP